jgi:hypothetical protein
VPIEFIQSPEGLKVSQSFDSPTVYLDHWAIRLFSDDYILQDRLIAALKQKLGTLLLSNFSLAEMGGASDQQHVIDTESFLERCLPRVFLTNFNLDQLQAREEKEQANTVRFWPTADLTQLKLFGELSLAAGRPFSLMGIAELAYQHRGPINALMRNNALQVIDALNKARADPDYVRKARHVTLDGRRPRSLLIMGELLRGFVLDSNATMSENDAVDLTHAAMPLNCCDYVLLDAPWAERVKKMKGRLLKSKIATMPIAKCFSQRDGGINAFLADLENFDPKSQQLPPRR